MMEKKLDVGTIESTEVICGPIMPDVKSVDEIIETLSTPPKPFIKRIISHIGTGISKESEILTALSPDNNADDIKQISRLLGDLIDNDDLVSAIGISGLFVCHKDSYLKYANAFNAIRETSDETGFFNGFFGDN